MKKKLCSGKLAYDYLAHHPEHWYELGDLFRLIRLPNGYRLPEGTALGQRLNDRFKADEREARARKQRPYAQRVYLEAPEQGAIKPVLYRMTRDGAKRYLAAQAEQRVKKVAA